VTGLTPLTTFNCIIYAFNGGPISDPVTVTTAYPGTVTACTCTYCTLNSVHHIIFPAAPNPPVLISVTTIDSQSVHATWRAPTQPNGVLTSYTISYHTNTGSDLSVDVPYNGRMVSTYYTMHV